MEEDGKEARSLTDDDSLPPIDRGWRAWRFVACGMILDCFTWGLTFAWSRYQAFYTTNPPFNKDSQVVISITGSLQLALLYSGILMGTQLSRRWPHHVSWAIWVAMAGFQLSLLIASFADSIALIVVFQGFFAGLFSTLTYAPLYLYLSEWFDKYLATAGSLVFSGAGIGGALFPVLTNALFERVGFRWTLRITALLGSVFCSLALLGLKPRRKPVKPDRSQRSSSHIRWSVFLDPLFLSNCTSVFVQGCFYSPIAVYISTYTATFASPATSGYVLAVWNAATIPGQITVGSCCDRMPYTFVQIASGLASTALVFGLLRVADTPALIYVFAALTGWFGGGYTSSWFPSSIDCAGKDVSQAAPIFGYLAVVRGVASIVSPILAGLLYDPDGQKADTAWGKKGLGSFVMFVGFMAAGTVASACLTEITRAFRRRGKVQSKA